MKHRTQISPYYVRFVLYFVYILVNISAHHALDAQITEGRVAGRGSCDMKGAFACYFEVVHMLRAHGVRLPGDLVIAGFVDEEHLQIGSAEMGRNGPHAEFGIVGEPASLEICPAHNGQLGVVIRSRGKATHTSRPEKGINAVEHIVPDA